MPSMPTMGDSAKVRDTLVTDKNGDKEADIFFLYMTGWDPLEMIDIHMKQLSNEHAS